MLRVYFICDRLLRSRAYLIPRRGGRRYQIANRIADELVRLGLAEAVDAPESSDQNAPHYPLPTTH